MELDCHESVRLRCRLIYLMIPKSMALIRGKVGIHPGGGDKTLQPPRKTTGPL